jgi:hypothetical protein
MSKHRRRNASKGGINPTNQTESPTEPKRPPTSSRRRLVWLFGVATTVVTTALGGVLASGLTGAWPRVVRVAEGWRPAPSAHAHPTSHGQAHPSTSPGPGGHTSPTPATKHHYHLRQPLQLMSEDPLDDWEVGIWVFRRGFPPSPDQVAQVGSDYQSAPAVNRDLYDDGAYSLFVYTKLVLRNELDRSLQILNIQAQPECTDAPLDGAVFDGEGQSSGSALPDSGPALGFNFASGNPNAVEAQGWDVSQWRQEYGDGSPITIPAWGSYGLNIKAVAPGKACKFSIRVTGVSDEGVTHQTFGDDGQPFRVSGVLPGLQRKAADHPFAGYNRLYLGESASPWGDNTWARENPATWRWPAAVSGRSPVHVRRKHHHR